MGKRTSNRGTLSLERFAEAKTSKYDKGRALEKLQEEKLRRRSQYKKLKQKLESEGKLNAVTVRDNIGELEDELMLGRSKAAPELKARKRSHSEASVHDALADTPSDSLALEEDEQSPVQPQTKRRHGMASEEHQPGKAVISKPKHLQQRQHTESEGQQQQQHSSSLPRGKGSVNTSSMQQQQQQQQPEHGGKHSTEGEGMKRGPRQHVSQLERLASKIQAQKDEERKSREEAARVRAEKQAKIEAAKKVRQQDKHKFFKRTSSGQPLMRYRMEKILSVLEREKK